MHAGVLRPPPLVEYFVTWVRRGRLAMKGTDVRGVLPDMITCASKAHYPDHCPVASLGLSVVPSLREWGRERDYS
eukprot:6193216-Pleurochrysis_carterae.AAC.2